MNNDEKMYKKKYLKYKIKYLSLQQKGGMKAITQYFTTSSLDNAEIDKICVYQYETKSDCNNKYKDTKCPRTHLGINVKNRKECVEKLTQEERKSVLQDINYKLVFSPKWSDFKNDKEIVLALVKKKGLSFLKYASEDLQNNEDIQKAAVEAQEEEKIRIIKLYNKLSSGDSRINYDELSTNILKIILESTHVEIDLLEYPQEQKKNMHETIERIYSSIPKTEKNHIGKVNIFSLQCIIVFTESCCDTSKQFQDNLNDIYDVYQKFKNINWWEYDVIKSEIKYNQKFKCLCYANTDVDADNSEEYSQTNLKGQIYLITPIKYFTLDEIIESFLNNKILCGISSNFSWEYGSYLTPFEFLVENRRKGYNFDGFCFKRLKHSINDLKSFYNYCRQTIDINILYACTLMIFLLIHETICGFFSTDPNSSDITKQNILYHIQSPSLLKRFVDPNDLFKRLPKTIRDEYTTNKDSQVISDYLDKISGIYREKLLNWIKYRKNINFP